MLRKKKKLTIELNDYDFNDLFLVRKKKFKKTSQLFYDNFLKLFKRRYILLCKGTEKLKNWTLSRKIYDIIKRIYNFFFHK